MVSGISIFVLGIEVILVYWILRLGIRIGAKRATKHIAEIVLRQPDVISESDLSQRVAELRSKLNGGDYWFSVLGIADLNNRKETGRQVQKEGIGISIYELGHLSGQFYEGVTTRKDHGS